MKWRAPFVDCILPEAAEGGRLISHSLEHPELDMLPNRQYRGRAPRNGPSMELLSHTLYYPPFKTMDNVTDLSMFVIS